MRGAFWLAASTLLGCAAPTGAAAPPDEGLPLLVAPAAVPVAEPEPEAEPPEPGRATLPCPLQWTPRELRTSVFTLPADLHGRMMAPLYRALCTCTRPGQHLALMVELIPDHGEVTARTADRPDQQARVSRGIDACLASALGAGRFEPFHVGSNLVVGDREGFAVIRTPLFLDRRAER